MRIITLIMGFLITLPSLANWQLSNDESQFNFITTKKNSGTEVQQFTQLKGKVSTEGEVTLTIDLTSVETNIPIRNERMQKFLFETNLFPQATFTSKLNNKEIDTLAVGETTQVDLEGEINLHGITQAVSTRVQATKLKSNKLLVTSLKPVVIQAQTFKLDAGVDKLKDLMMLPNINYSVPVTFSFTFTQ